MAIAARFAARRSWPGRRKDDAHCLRQPFRSFGYLPGQNDAYRQANAWEKMATLCRACHQRVEQGQRLGVWAGRPGLCLGQRLPAPDV